MKSTLRDKLSLSSLLFIIYLLFIAAGIATILVLQKPELELYIKVVIIITAIIYILFSISYTKLLLNIWKGKHKMIKDPTKQQLSFAVLHTLFNFAVIIFLIISVESSTILLLTPERKFLCVIGLFILIIFTVHTAKYDYNNYLVALNEDIEEGTKKMISESMKEDNNERSEDKWHSGL